MKSEDPVDPNAAYRHMKTLLQRAGLPSIRFHDLRHTFACLAAMDGAETVSAYARFNCTVRYDAASDEYIVVVLYG